MHETVSRSQKRFPLPVFLILFTIMFYFYVFIFMYKSLMTDGEMRLLSHSVEMK